MVISIAEKIDCMEGMKKYPDKYFDLLIGDPPWGLNVTNMKYVQYQHTAKQHNGSKILVNKRKHREDKHWDLSPPPQAYFDEVRRVSRNQIIFGVEYFNWEGLGTGRIRWDKCVPEKMSFKGYEMAYCSLFDHTEEIKLLWSGMRQAKSLREPTVQQGNKRLNEKRIHPTQKPKLLYQRLLTDYASPTDKVLDTHLGSGSIRIVAYKMGIEFHGFEIDSDIFNDQEKRFYIETTDIFNPYTPPSPTDTNIDSRIMHIYSH